MPVAHKIYGVPQTINCANYVYFLAYQQLSNLQERMRESSTNTGRSHRPNLLSIVNGEPVYRRAPLGVPIATCIGD